MRFGYVALLLLTPCLASAYSVLTHEAVIDSAWDDSLKPLLLQRYPDSTADQLREAQAYAYGGAIIQDMGYYPSGSHLFSDLTHYIKSGDFITNMIDQASTLDEYAFALGALAHFSGDDQGHSLAVNPSVPMLYPKLARKYGPVMTYEQNPTAHLRTEFAFDVLQVARGYYAPQAYHDFIGFQVSYPALERAFETTYCIRLEDTFKNIQHSLNTYRHTVSGLIPKATKVAWVMKKKELQQHTPGVVRRKFIYNITRASYEKEWGKDYDRPSLGERTLAFILRIIPHVGPLRALSFKVPTPASESLFMKGFDATLDNYRTLLKAVGTNTLKLPEMNFDTGQPTQAGTYRLADEARAQLAQVRVKSTLTCK